VNESSFRLAAETNRLAACAPQSGKLAKAFGVTAATAERSPLGDELSAGSFGCGKDLVEALITAQRIPAGIKAEIAVCRRISGKGRNFFQLLKRAVTLARSRRLFCRQFLKTPIVADSIPDRIESQRCGSKKRRSRV
jgi:hypothetical protein